MNSVRQPADFPQMLAAATSERVRVQLAASWIHSVFDQFYQEFLRLTWSAKSAFETRDYAASVASAKKRLGLYNATVYALAWDLRAAFPALAQRESLWAQVEAAFLPAVEGRYEADLALAYIHSARRRVHHGEWTPVEYGFGEQRATAGPDNAVYETFPCSWPLDQRVMQAILQVAELSVPFRDPGGDASRIARRLNDVLAGKQGAGLRAIEMIRGGFFRNRGAYLVGRLVLDGDQYRPFVIALVNEVDGVVAAAVLHVVSHVHNLFNTTEAPCQVTNLHYHELSAFLHSIMPRRPLGLHYSTIGFHHVAKVAVMNEVRRHLGIHRELLDTAPGFPGTVAIAFTSPRSDYVLKVIRDRPTDGYKWDSFEGVDVVLEKYKRVHEINRTGSMLDNILYYNLKLDCSWFKPALMNELLSAASNAVQLQGEALVFKYLVVQRKLTPLNVFLVNAPEDKASRAIVNLGYCIRNNAAANVFNKDFDARNYGVSRYLKVFLYDYDAVEILTDVKVRTNLDRCEGEEDVPGWFFEDGVVFLPEEIDVGLRVASRSLRRAFREAHGDLMTVEYWERLQHELRAGEVPGIHTFPESCYLSDPGVETVANE
ncbi:MAG TPA: isocitrate dehydrogenase kinase/phosphatase AceK regulatory subunit [Steroidobacteraceae bacterium]